MENLEYVTNSENIIHAHNNGLIKKYQRKVTKRIISTGERITYTSETIAAQENQSTVSYIIKRCKCPTKSGRKDNF